ncbi:hypothetical protein K438DRAFT_1930612 [Mycena galopus ATCC 62051]|nr:hypothetical protein K438DRAFT_1930612 [Mycena galopus ATCC 62051]
MTTISSLPNELLQAIAVAGQKERVEDLQSAFKSEWTLTHVSRRFRDAIIGAPLLWTLVDANLDAEGSVEILKLYLQRSQGCNNIQATLQFFPITFESDLIAERIGHFIQHIDRVCRLRILFEDWDEGMLDSFRRVAAPNLRHLEVVNQNRFIRNESGPIELFSGGVPRLAFLKIETLKLQLPAPQWLASLTHLELWRGWHFGESSALPVQITAQCPLLVALRLDMSWTDGMEHRVHIPSLKSLHLWLSDSADEDYLLVILNIFDTPALTDCIIDNTHGDQIFVLFNSPTLPQVVFPALTSLHFITGEACDCEPASFPSAPSSPPIKRFPSLTSLTLINQCFTTNVVESLLGPASWPLPLPNTITLCPEKRALEAVSDALRIAVHSKRQSGQSLPKFRLSPALSAFGLEDWQGVDVEILHRVQVIDVALPVEKAVERRLRVLDYMDAIDLTW